jgi:hypothetical protein
MNCWFRFFEKTKIGIKEPPPVPVISKKPQQTGKGLLVLWVVI